MARLQEFYRDKVVPDLIKKFGYTSKMQAPRITKITLNMGVSEAVSDKKVMDHAVSDLSKIAGQKPVVTKSKKAIAGFKIRDGVPIGCMSFWGTSRERCGCTTSASCRATRSRSS